VGFYNIKRILLINGKPSLKVVPSDLRETA
jgi:hypothetical protein